MVRFVLAAGVALLIFLGHSVAIPVVSDPTTTVFSAEATVPPDVPHTDVTSHGPYDGPSPTTTGALSTDVLAASIPALPPGPEAYSYPSDGQLHAPEPAPYTPAGGQGTNGSAPVYRVLSDFDYESIALGLYQEWIELDLFHWGLATFSDKDFEDAGLTAQDRYLIQFMAEQEVGHATLLSNILGGSAPKQCTYNYPVSNVREYVDFCQKLTRFGESGVYGFLNHLDSRPVGQLLLQSISTEARQQMIFRQFQGLFPMPVWFEVGTPQSWAWTLLAPYISSCPENQTRLIWQNYPSVYILNQPNPVRINGADVRNETTGGHANSLSTAGVPADQDCLNSDEVGVRCAPAVTNNRSTPLSYPGRQVFLRWDSQLNVTYSPLEEVRDNSGWTVQPNMSTYAGDPAVNGTMYLILTDEDLYVTPFNLTQVNPHVYGVAAKCPLRTSKWPVYVTKSSV
ncbi:ferritin-like domain-containing protein [Lasiosphaeria hispida]|uniref:Ferritin-like domain-containing protein n=1 Tax=Lasiosphaeria hispida TaxID=260671 RepID=A0AAJ0HFE6_9PEZI|nr:ferritin-like domain-containing protein [Lasiosphaeria hispida]